MKYYVQITEGFLTSSKSQSKSISVLALTHAAGNKYVSQAKLQLNFEVLMLDF